MSCTPSVSMPSLLMSVPIRFVHDTWMPDDRMYSVCHHCAFRTPMPETVTSELSRNRIAIVFAVREVSSPASRIPRPSTRTPVTPSPSMRPCTSAPGAR